MRARGARAGCLCHLAQGGRGGWGGGGGGGGAGGGRGACGSPPRLPSQMWDVGALGPGWDPGRRGGLRGDGVAGWALGGEYGVWTARQVRLRDLFGFVVG